MEAKTKNAYAGTDNYGRPKTDYLAKLAAMTDDQLGSECYSIIYHAARCANNPRADWHWMADACYDESKRRGKDGSIYGRAFDRCYKDARPLVPASLSERKESHDGTA